MSFYFLNNNFLNCAGDSQTGIHKRSVYEHNGVAVCSQKRALFIATIVMAILFTISLILAYAGPQAGELSVSEFIGSHPML